MRTSTIRKLGKIKAVLKRIETLFDESQDIFFQERPFLEDVHINPKILKIGRRKDNEEAIEEAQIELAALNQELRNEFPKETFEPKQTSLL